MTLCCSRQTQLRTEQHRVKHMQVLSSPQSGSHVVSAGTMAIGARTWRMGIWVLARRLAIVAGSTAFSIVGCAATHTGEPKSYPPEQVSFFAPDCTWVGFRSKYYKDDAETSQFMRGQCEKAYPGCTTPRVTRITRLSSCPILYGCACGDEKARAETLDVLEGVADSLQADAGVSGNPTAPAASSVPAALEHGPSTANSAEHPPIVRPRR